MNLSGLWTLAAAAGWGYSDFANAILAEHGEEARSFEEEQHAQRLLDKMLGRLPESTAAALISRLEAGGQ